MSPARTADAIPTVLILIVDDSEEDRTAIRLCLSEAACGAGVALRFSESEKGGAGLAAYRAETPACIVLDYNLPDMTGLKFLTRLRGPDGKIPVPVVMLTGSRDRSLPIAALQAGAQEYLPKRLLDTEMLWRAVQAARSRFVLLAERQRSETALAVSDHLLRVANERAGYERKLEQSNADLNILAAELVQARDAAQQANRAKSRFLSGMSHELRTPLNGILGNARLLRLEGGLQPAQLARVDSMLSAGSHLLEMIHCVLDLSEIETERVVLRTETVDLRAVVSACLDIVRHLAAEKGLALTLSVAADVPLLAAADPVRLRQILLNLLGNAVKFTNRGSIDLRLRTTADGASLRCDIADTGPGIPRQHRQTLFQDFVRVQQDGSRTAEGAGLGLALSSRLAALMGGQLGHIDNPGGGAIFWFELPLLAGGPPELHHDIAGAASFAVAAQQNPARKLHVLVVDDSEMNLDIAASFIRFMGHEVSCLGSGAEAVAALALTCFDMVFMDVQMPGMDGLEATRLIRALPGASGRVPIVALTAQVFTEQLDACRLAGMSGHLCKPFTEAALYATLTRCAPEAPEGRSAAIPATALAEAELPVMDADIFTANTRVLKPAAVIAYLEMIVGDASAVLSGLHSWDGAGAIGHDVLLATHKLAGNVGLLGFVRAADAARRFECAERNGAASARLLAESLAAALGLSIQEAERRLSAPGVRVDVRHSVTEGKVGGDVPSPPNPPS
jgi:signal transduction histidine kinase